MTLQYFIYWCLPNHINGEQADSLIWTASKVRISMEVKDGSTNLKVGWLAGLGGENTGTGGFPRQHTSLVTFIVYKILSKLRVCKWRYTSFELCVGLKSVNV